MAQGGYRQKNDASNAPFSMLFLFSVAVSLFAWNTRFILLQLPTSQILRNTDGNVKPPSDVIDNFILCDCIE